MNPRDLLKAAGDLLVAGDREAVARTAVPLLAELASAQVAVLVPVSAGELCEEAWWPDDEATRTRHRPFLRGLALESMARGGSVVTPPPPGHGPARVLVERLVVGERPVAVLCALCAPDAGAEPNGMAEALRLTGHALAQRAELVVLRSERARQERWFKQLDQHIRVLDRERQKFAAIVNQSDTYVFTADAGRIVRWTNRALGGALPPGGTPSWAGQSCDALWERFERDPAWRCPVAEALASERPVRAELGRRTADGVQPLWATALPIRAPEGRTHEVLVIVQDLSSVGALQRAEERVRAVLEHAPIILFAFDHEGRITLSLGKALAALGLAPGQSVGTSVWDLYRDRPDILDNVRRALAGESFNVQNDLGAVSLETHFAPMHGAGGRGAIGVAIDITERRRLEAELRQAHEMEAAAHLAAAVAHEFNNLLTVIMGHAELIRSQLRIGHPLRMCADEVQRAGQQGALLTRRLLTLGRADAAQPELLAVTPLLTETATMLRGLLSPRTALAVRTDEPQHGALRVRADRARLEQALASIVVSARDAMRHGGQVTLTAASVPGDCVRIAVRHEARMLMADGAQMHDRAMLTLVRAVAHRLGGTLEVEGDAAQGSVTLVLPGGEERAEAA